MCKHNIPRWMLIVLVGTLMAIGTAVVEAQAQQQPTPLTPFVLPWDDATNGITNVSWLNEKPAGKRGFIKAKDGHLYAGDRRIRFFGVNVVFKSCFPSHEDADKVAARMAKFGINCVRFHQMDSSTAPDGLFSQDRRSLDPDQLDKLDYFVAQLKKNGIYADLNLRVSRSYPGLPNPGNSFKGIDNYYPPTIVFQKEYAHDLLLHVNKYTGNRYIDEPTVAVVEINNENGLARTWWDGKLDNIPELYSSELSAQWQHWLQAKYTKIENLQQAWGIKDDEKFGDEMLTNADFSKGMDHWNVERNRGAEATFSIVQDGPNGKPAFRIVVDKPAAEGWLHQVHQMSLKLVQDNPYTLTFWAKADANRRTNVTINMAHAPWTDFWSTSVNLPKDWQQFHFVFRAPVSDDNARMDFSNFGLQAGTYSFADCSLRAGGVVSLDAKNGQWPRMIKKIEYGAYPKVAQRDWTQFLFDTEDTYWATMRNYLKDELHAQNLILGTQMDFSPLLVQSKMDITAINYYWQHPYFPEKSWDREKWSVGNTSMAGDPMGGTLPHMAFQHVDGKPYIVTEYNHSAPNTYSSEGFLLLSAFAALQDWDGFFVYAYSYRGGNAWPGEWNAGRITNILEIDQHPTKMATLPAAAALFLRGDVQPTKDVISVPFNKDMAIDTSRRLGPRGIIADKKLPSLTPFAQTLRSKIVTDTAPMTAETSLDVTKPVTSENGQFTWEPSSDKGAVIIDSELSKQIIGFVSERTFNLHGVQITPGQNRQNWATISLTVMEGKGFSSSGRVLLTTTGYVENTNMKWKNEQHTSVGKDWGTSPSLVECIPATITLPVTAKRVQVWSLDERGQRKAPVTIREVGGKATFDIDTQYQTLWYEIVIQ
ncbi:MAG TPA: carbohydrate binding domain-containing protein [Armatimonadota bacterium]|nr:carbohydrate binding domain-containing protein [Armatimonadota bacterium]